MARSLEQHLAALRKLDARSPGALDELRQALRVERPGAGVVVAAAARFVAEHRIDAVVPELVAAFEALLENPNKRDPGCIGKLAITRALHELEHWDNRVFVTGLSVVQLEGYAGNLDDTAAPLRGMCGLAHAHLGRADALDVLAGLLADKERTTRVAAARGIGDSGRIDGTALLRYKLLVGEADGEVLAACFESLLALNRDGSIDFVVALLEEHDDRAEAAALALGAARVTEAGEALARWADDCRPEQRHRVGYLALALLRSDAATAKLLDAIRTRSRGDAIGAAQALATFKDDRAIAQQIREAMAEVTDRAVILEIEKLLAS